MNHLNARLTAYLEDIYPSRQELSVSELADISDGWESEMFSFILSYGAAPSRTEEKLVLRIYPGDDATEKSERESTAMRRLLKSGYPVPRICAVESSGRGRFDRPFVLMEFVDGQVMWPMLAQTPDDASMALIKMFCSLFVRLHALDWRPFASREVRRRGEDPYRFIDSWFSKGIEALKHYPVIDLHPLLSWLEQRRDELACPKPSPVHQDFHPGNVLVGDDGQAIVIDWTGFDVSDYRIDLAWTLLLAYAHTGQEYREVTLKMYEEELGSRMYRNLRGVSLYSQAFRRICLSIRRSTATRNATRSCNGD